MTRWFAIATLLLAIGVALPAIPGRAQTANCVDVDMCRRLADQGDAAAQFKLGTMYKLGQGVPQDYGAAAKWYRKAADQGDALAQSSLGRLYFLGQGVPQDYVQARKWLSLAAAKGSTDAATLRDFVATKMTQSQIGKAQGLAAAWKPTGQ
jgi:TPR repeat protein